MIAIPILTTWLTLTAAGFAGLSALRRGGAREDAEAEETPFALQASAFADARISISKALAQ
jgi:hypothetical protein